MIEELNGLDELPHGWIRTQLGEIAEIILGQSPPSSTYNEDGRGLPFYQGKLEFGKSYPTPRKWCMAPKKIAEKGDVLISVRAPVGPTNVCPEKSCIGRGLAAIRGLGGIGTFFILYVLRAFENDIARKGTGTTFSAIGGDKLKALEIPLPPFNEQVRIVAKLEALFTRLDAGVEGLRKVKAQLKRYRQAVLKYSFEGKLTEEWRKIHKEGLEAPENLMERIAAAKTKTPGKKFREPPKLDVDNLPDIPSEWCWQNFSLVIKKVKRGPSLKCNQEGKGFRYITSGNLQDGRLRLDLDYKFLDNFQEVDRCKLFPKDLILNCVNSLEQIGKSAIFEREHGEAVVGFNNYALELDTEFILPEYANAVCQSYFFKAQVYFLIKRAVNQVSFATRELDFMAIPLPSLSEQRVIFDKVERYFSLADEVNSDLETSLKQAENLRQSILKTAFEGKLVPQDTDDEPADKLLQRIREERAKSMGEKNTNKRRKSKPRQLELSTYVK